MEGGKLWEETLRELRSRIPEESFEAWLKGTKGVGVDGDSLVVGVPSSFVLEWLDKRMRPIIEETLSKVSGRSLNLRFEVLGATSKKPSPFNPKYTFSSFIVGDSNRLAHAAALAVAENPGGSYNPLFIYGGVGLGKTHLLHAIGNKTYERMKVLYTTAEQFTNEFILAIKERRTEDFREKYRTVDILLIDDIHFIAGKEQTQEGIFHTFNDLHNAGKQIVISSDRHPRSLPLLEERLRSRFEWGLIVDIQPPDYETRLAILQAKAEEEGGAPIDVLKFIARKFTSNIRELEGALNKVFAFSRIFNLPLNIDTAVRALQDVKERRRITKELVLEVISEYFGIPVETIKGRRRDKPVALARQIAMYLLREELSMSWTEIGKFLGGKDHSTVIHGYEKTAYEMDINPALRREVLNIKETLYSRAGEIT